VTERSTKEHGRSTEPRTLVIMAAGLGSRYGGVKQMEPVGPSGEILLDYSVYDAVQAGFERIVLIVRAEIEADVRALVESTFGQSIEVAYVCQSMDAVPDDVPPPPDRVKPWGTGHAVLQCRGVIHDAFGAINADDFYGRDAFARLRELTDDAKATDERLRIGLVSYRLERTLSDHGHVTRGVCALDTEGRLTAIHERKQIQRFGEAIRYQDDGAWHDLPEGTPVSMNMWAFPGPFLDQLTEEFSAFLHAPSTDLVTSEFLLPEVVGSLVRQDRAVARAKPTEEEWCGMTYPEYRNVVRDRIRALTERGVYPDSLWG